MGHVNLSVQVECRLEFQSNFEISQIFTSQNTCVGEAFWRLNSKFEFPPLGLEMVLEHHVIQGITMTILHECGEHGFDTLFN